MARALIMTGIPKLDELTDGLLPGSSMLLVGTPGIDKMGFAMQIVAEQVRNRRDCAYVVTDKLPAAVRDYAERMGFPTDSRISFVDVFSATIGLGSKEQFVVADPNDVRSLTAVLSQAVTKCHFLIFDSLTDTFITQQQEAASATKEWLRICKAAGVVSVWLFTDWKFDPELLSRLKGLFDIVVNMKAVEERALLRNYFIIERAPFKVPDVMVPFRVGIGGVAVYVPKILVTGPWHAGKSSFIHAISSRAVSVDRFGTTIALDHGYIERDGFAADVFGTPGQEHFDFMLNVLGRDTFGIILVVDSAAPTTFPRALQMIERTRLQGIPFVIAANKQDMADALRPGQIRARMGLPDDVPVVPCIAPRKKGCLDVFKALFELMIKR